LKEIASIDEGFDDWEWWLGIDIAVLLGNLKKLFFKFQWFDLSVSWALGISARSTAA
jgi:hypothetical protein